MRGVLVFEDLSESNFASVQKAEGMDMDHLKISLSTLAKWHATTAVLLLEVITVNQMAKIGLKIFYCTETRIVRMDHKIDVQKFENY